MDKCQHCSAEETVDVLLRCHNCHIETDVTEKQQAFETQLKEARAAEAELRRIVDEIATLFHIVPETIAVLPLCVKAYFDERMKFFTELNAANEEVERLRTKLENTEKYHAEHASSRFDAMIKR